MNFIDFKRNDQFSSLSENDLKDLINKIENFDLVYRDSLGLSDDVSFGVEIEFEGTDEDLVDEYIEKNFKAWIMLGDTSLKSGGEVISPVLYDDIKTWKALKDICNFLKENNADTFHNAAGHIHIGAPILGENIDNWKNFLKTYILYENILFRFLYGDKIGPRKRITDFAEPISLYLYSNMDKILNSRNIYHLKEFLPSFDKKKAINFKNVMFYDINNFYKKNTIEFRSPNATIEEVIWQNNINVLVKLLLSASKIDQDFLDYKLNKKMFVSDFDMYNKIDLQTSLEFADLIFQNNLDKLYFLRQYIKNYEESCLCISAKRFVR